MRSDRLRLRDIRATTPFRLSLLAGMLLLAGIVASLAMTYVLTARNLTARSDQILHARAAALVATDPAALPARIRGEIANAAPGFSYFALESRDGEPIVGNIRVQSPPRIGQPFMVRAAPGARGPVRVLAVRTAAGETIVIGRDVTQIGDLRRQLLATLAVSGVTSTLVVLAAAVLLGLAPLRRVRDLQRASRAIAAGDHDARMLIAGRHDELDQFAATVNQTMDELVRVIAQVKAATDAIAHDLRTPLTRVRAALYRARAEARDPRQASILGDAVADLDAVIDRFGALLRIAELEASGRRSGFGPIDLDGLLREVVDLYEPLAEERGIALTLACDRVAAVEADRALMFEAVGNLVDNAIKFARAEVALRVVGPAGDAAIEVIDDGLGIPAAEREAVVRRFHRARGAAGKEGTGLGLSVVVAILHIHGFALVLGDRIDRPGLVARIRLGGPSAGDMKII